MRRRRTTRLSDAGSFLVGTLIGVALVLVVGLALGGCTGCVPASVGASVRATAQASDAGMLALAGDDPRTVRLLFARNGSMVLIKEIRLPPGEVVTELSLSADGRDLLIATQSQCYLASANAWQLEAVALARAAAPKAG
ncbi:MAG TPA: hypothetical protein VL742_03575 [Casimicrobiaceae bacterium]|nr:hypothetical protein [Casimicrobiaceae bacterium]